MRVLLALLLILPAAAALAQSPREPITWGDCQANQTGHGSFRLDMQPACLALRRQQLGIPMPAADTPEDIAKHQHGGSTPNLTAPAAPN